MLRVATYNIRHGVGSSGHFDRRAMVDACRSLDVDILALCEVDRRSMRTRWCDEPARIGAATGLVPHFATTRNLGPLGRYGLALLTRGRPVAVDDVVLPHSAQRRVAIVADLAVAASGPDRGFAVTIAATHLQHDESVAMGQLAALLDHLDQRVSDGRPVLLMGDLNCGSALVVPALTARGYVVAESGPTFPAGAPERRLDWIAGRGLEFDDVDVPALVASDHRPIVASCRHL